MQGLNTGSRVTSAADLMHQLVASVGRPLPMKLKPVEPVFPEEVIAMIRVVSAISSAASSMPAKYLANTRAVARHRLAQRDELMNRIRELADRKDCQGRIATELRALIDEMKGQ